MRKSKTTKTARLSRSGAPVGRSLSDPDDLLEPISKREIRILKRRLDDSQDRTRYLLISRFAPGHTMYFNISEGSFSLNNPLDATIFKRRPTARVIRSLVGKDGETVKCRVNKTGRLMPGSLPKTMIKGGKTREKTAALVMRGAQARLRSAEGSDATGP
jgi:hypothetical protein